MEALGEHTDPGPSVSGGNSAKHKAIVLGKQILSYWFLRNLVAYMAHIRGHELIHSSILSFSILPEHHIGGFLRVLDRQGTSEGMWEASTSCSLKKTTIDKVTEINHLEW